MMAKSGEIAPSRERWAMAGASSRRVRSPEAPKITSVHGGRILSSASASGVGAAATGGSRTPRRSFSFGLHRVPAELIPQRRDDLRGERFSLARREAREERGGQ